MSIGLRTRLMDLTAQMRAAGYFVTAIGAVRNDQLTNRRQTAFRRSVTSATANTKRSVPPITNARPDQFVGAQGLAAASSQRSGTWNK